MAINFRGLLDRISPSAAGLSEDERRAIARRGLLSLGMGILGAKTGGSFGASLAEGIQSGVQGVDQGIHDLASEKYRNDMMARTRAGMQRNSSIEAAQAGVLNPDGTINQEKWGQWATIDPVGAAEFRKSVTPKQENNWQIKQVGDGSGGLLDVWVDEATQQIRDLSGNILSGGSQPQSGLLAKPQPASPASGLLSQAAFPTLASAVMQVESGGNPDAVSPKGAIGTMQTMPATLVDPGYGVLPARDRSSDELERVGKDYLAAMTQKYEDPRMALAAYNWGPGNVDRALSSSGGNADAVLASAPKETRNYVAKVARRVGGGGASQSVPSPMQGRLGSRPAKPAASAQGRYRPLSREEVSSYGLPDGTVAQMGPNGQIQVISRPPASAAKSGTAGNTSEGERNAAGFYSRMEAARKEMDALTNAGYDPTTFQDRVGDTIDNAPLIGGLLAPIGRAITSSDGQQYQQAAMNWVRANLRKESGAVIGKDEAMAEYRNYFPVVGDSKEVIEQKNRNRAIVEQAMRTAGGRALQSQSPSQPSSPSRKRYNPATGRIE